MAYKASWTQLPSDLLPDILSRADSKDTKAIRCVCRAWRDAVSNNLAHLTPKLLHPGIATCYPRLRSLDLSNCTLESGEELVLLIELTSLEALVVQLPEQRKLEAAQHLASLASVTALDLSRSQHLVDDQLAIIVQRGILRHLNIADCSEVTDAGIARLAEHLLKLETMICSTSTWGNLASSKLTDRSCHALGRLARLTHLDLRNHSQITKAGLHSLAALSQLRVLKLANCRAVCDGGLEAVGVMTGLAELQISFTGGLPSWMDAFTAGGLAHLAPLQQLLRLKVAGCDWDLTRAELSRLSALSQLTDLDLSHYGRRLSKLDGRVLQHFPLERLRSLRLNKNRLGKSGMGQLQRATALTHLDLTECTSITDADLTCLADLTELRSLHIDDCDNLSPHSPPAWAWIRKLTQLRDLQWASKFSSPSWLLTQGALDDLPCVAALMAHADCLTGLQRLSIARQGLAPAAKTLSQLALLTQLTDLDMQGVYCEGADEFDSVVGAISSLTRLETLNVACTRTKSEGLRAIGKLQALTELNLSRTPVADCDLHHLKPLIWLRTLRVDDQRFQEALCDGGLRRIAHISSLTSLSLRGNCAVASQGLAVLSRLQSLASLDLRGALNVCAPSALRYLQGCTALTELYLGEPDGTCHPPFCAPKSFVHESEIKDFHRRLPFLRRVIFGGEVVTSRTSYALSVMQCKLHSVLLDLCKAYVYLVAKYDTVQSVARA